MHARCPIRPHTAIKPKIRSQRRWQGFYSSLPIIASRELHGTHLASNEALLCTCRKEPSVPARHRSVHIQYRSLIETVSMRQAAAWTASNLRHSPFWMECILASHIHNAKRPCMAKRGETQTRRWVPFGIGPIHPSHDFPVVPPCIAKRDELVWLYRK